MLKCGRLAVGAAVFMLLAAPRPLAAAETGKGPEKGYTLFMN